MVMEAEVGVAILAEMQATLPFLLFPVDLVVVVALYLLSLLLVSMPAVLVLRSFGARDNTKSRQDLATEGEALVEADRATNGEM